MGEKAISEAISELINDKRSKSVYTRSQFLNAIKVIRTSYSDENLKTDNATLIDYRNEVYRLAYVYLYLPSHSNIVKNSLVEFQPSLLQLEDLWYHYIRKRCNVTVCSLGGGPGTDIFGLAMFFKHDPYFQSLKIHGTVLDKFPLWQKTADELKNKLQVANVKKLQYYYFDFFQLEANILKKIRDADIITIVKFISAVAADRCICAQQLKIILRSVKANALVLFLDNSGGGYHELFADGAKKEGLEQKCFMKYKFEIPSKEKKIIEKRSKKKREYKPQLKVKSSIWIKPAFNLPQAISNFQIDTNDPLPASA